MTLRNDVHRFSQNNCIADLFENKNHSLRILKSVKYQNFLCIYDDKVVIAQNYFSRDLPFTVHTVRVSK